MTFTQTYDPLHSFVLSTLLAALPIVLLLGLLATGRVPAHAAALAGLVAAVLAAVFGFAPPEAATDGGTAAWAGTMLAAAADGAAYGLFPIGWIVLTAIFLYALTVETGQFELVKHSVMGLSADRRIQALLIAFCFGAFIEGAAGFGTPVAISAALLMGAGFKPIQAAGLALLANTSPVAFGALGTPITMLTAMTAPAGADEAARAAWELRLSQMAGRQLPFFSLIVPVWLVATMGGWRAVRGVWPALLVTGGSFALVQFLVANFVGPALVDVAAGLTSLVALAVFLRAWQPAPDPDFASTAAAPAVPPSRGSVVRAWVPWLLLSALVFLVGLKPVKNWLNEVSAPKFRVPALDERISRAPPVAPEPAEGRPLKREEATFTLNWLSATGTAIFAAALLSAAWLGVGPGRFLRIFAATCHRMRWPLFTIACMLALAFVTRYSGMDATLGLAFTRTGRLYPFFAALLGWLGVALTGSDTSSNALFGGLQKITAEGLVRGGLLPAAMTEGAAVVLMATANSTGGVMGKMIDAQSIVVSAAATGQPGQEGPILRFVFWHSLALAVLMGLLVLAQAYLWPGVIP